MLEGLVKKNDPRPEAMEIFDLADFACYLAPCLDVDSWLAMRLVNKRWLAFFELFCAEPDLMMGFCRPLGGDIAAIDLYSYLPRERIRAFYLRVLHAQLKRLTPRARFYEFSNLAGVLPRSLAFTREEAAYLFGGEFDSIYIQYARDIHKYVLMYLLSDDAIIEMASAKATGNCGASLAFSRGLRVWRVYNYSRIKVRCPLIPREQHAEFIGHFVRNVLPPYKLDWHRMCDDCKLAAIENSRHLNYQECLYYIIGCNDAILAAFAKRAPDIRIYAYMLVAHPASVEWFKRLHQLRPDLVDTVQNRNRLLCSEAPEAKEFLRYLTSRQTRAGSCSLFFFRAARGAGCEKK